MSEVAELRRLEQVDQLRELCLLLMKEKGISQAQSTELCNRMLEEKHGLAPEQIEQIEHSVSTEQIKLPNVEQD